MHRARVAAFCAALLALMTSAQNLRRRSRRAAELSTAVELVAPVGVQRVQQAVALLALPQSP